MIMNPILRVINITKFFGGLTALLNINIEAREGQIVGIIGPNGAGKTTLFNCLTGLYYPTEGQIFFQDLPIVPQLSTLKKKFVHRMAVSFLILGLLWVPLLVAFFLPRTYFKVELVLLAIFVMVIRYLVIHGLKQFQIWAWSVTFVFLLADMFLAVWWLGHPSSLGLFLNSSIPLAYFAFPWSLFMIAFGMFFFWQLLLREVRQLFGFRVGPDAICKYGISRTFQNIRLFLSLSVLDNVKIGSHVRLNSGLWTTLFKAPSQRQEEQTIEQKTLEILRFVGLEHRAFDLAGALPYGEQRRLEIARALASNPKLLLLDEPAAGMNPQESMRLIRLIRKIRDTGVTVLIIEHDMKVMMNLADEIYALDHGELIAHGVPDEIRTNPKVIEAYLGGSLAYAEA